VSSIVLDVMNFSPHFHCKGSL